AFARGRRGHARAREAHRDGVFAGRRGAVRRSRPGGRDRSRARSGRRRRALGGAGRRMAAGQPIAEHELQRWIIERFERANLEFDHPAIVAAGPNAADPHYAPSPSRPRTIQNGELLLIDLWAKERGGIFADQTWMGAIGAPSTRAITVWEA